MLYYTKQTAENKDFNTICEELRNPRHGLYRIRYKSPYTNYTLDMEVNTYDEMPIELTKHVCSSPTNTLVYNSGDDAVDFIMNF